MYSMYKLYTMSRLISDLIFSIFLIKNTQKWNIYLKNVVGEKKLIPSASKLYSSKVLKEMYLVTFHQDYE